MSLLGGWSARLNLKRFYFLYMEIWKDIPRYENYQVSTFGRVKRKECTIVYKNGVVCNYPEKYLKPDLVKNYLRITLCKKNQTKRFLLHRLVCIVFLENINNKPCVNHKDGKKQNNDISNLEWVTYSENERHSYDVLNKIPSCSKMIINIQNGIFYNTIQDAANSIGMKHSTLAAKLSGTIPNNNTYFIYA